MAAVLPLYFADYWGRIGEFGPLRENIRSWATTFETTAIDYRSQLSSITARTLVVTGRHDFICGPVWAEMLHKGIADSRLVILEESGHFGHLEEPAAFAEAVRWLLLGFADEVRAAFRRGDSAEVLRLADEELRRSRSAGEPAGEVEALYAMSRVALRNDDGTLAEHLARTALEVAERSGDRRLEERPRHVLAAVARLAGDHRLARERYLAGIELNRELGLDEQVTSESYNLAFTELHLGNPDRARELFAEQRERVFQAGDGDHPRAARMIGFADSAFAAAGQVPDPDDAAELSRIRESTVAALGEDRFAFDYAGGAVLDPVAAFGINWAH